MELDAAFNEIWLMIRIDTNSYQILCQKYGLPSQKCGNSAYISQYCDNRIPHTYNFVSEWGYIQL